MFGLPVGSSMVFFLLVCVCVGWLEDGPIGLLGVAGLGYEVTPTPLFSENGAR